MQAPLKTEHAGDAFALADEVVEDVCQFAILCEEAAAMEEREEENDSETEDESGTEAEQEVDHFCDMRCFEDEDQPDIETGADVFVRELQLRSMELHRALIDTRC